MKITRQVCHNASMPLPLQCDLTCLRQMLNPDGHTTSPKDKILTVNVKPGWKEVSLLGSRVTNVSGQGTRVTFPNDGDQGPNIIPADIVFIVKYRDHVRFKREVGTGRRRLTEIDALGQ